VSGEQRIRFAVLGPPVAWHRPKLSRSNRIDGRGVRVIKRSEDVNYQSALALQATSAMMRWAHENGQPWDASGEFHVDAEFHVHDLIKRDVDNILKNVMDGLSSICFNDDRQVVSVRMCKRLNRDKPRTVVSVWRTEGHLDG
jgi:Holliday junction resolvase RusA-like endonuclease